MKNCSKCSKEWPVSMFPKSGGSGKLSSWCRQCHSDRAQVLRMALEQSNLEFFKSDPIEKIESTIRERGITVISVAQAIGVSEQNAYKWFARKTLPRQKNLLAMYQYLGIETPPNLLPDVGGKMPLGVGVCPECGVTFPVYKSGRKFCSRECQGVELSKRQLGAGNAMWSGGTHVTSAAGGGYIKEKSPGHPKADASDYVMQHRLVMERMIGRLLETHERVHHKNGNRQDNRPENLELWTGVGTSKKDPQGVRVVDKVLDMLDSLTADERKQVRLRLAQLDPA